MQVIPAQRELSHSVSEEPGLYRRLFRLLQVVIQGEQPILMEHMEYIFFQRQIGLLPGKKSAYVLFEGEMRQYEQRHATQAQCYHVSIKQAFKSIKLIIQGNYAFFSLMVAPCTFYSWYELKTSHFPGIVSKDNQCLRVPLSPMVDWSALCIKDCILCKVLLGFSRKIEPMQVLHRHKRGDLLEKFAPVIMEESQDRPLASCRP